jgi:hypothetical protein
MQAGRYRSGGESFSPRRSISPHRHHMFSSHDRFHFPSRRSQSRLHFAVAEGDSRWPSLDDRNCPTGVLQGLGRRQQQGGRLHLCRDKEGGRASRGSEDFDVVRNTQAQGQSGTAVQRYVSYYFTNFPTHLSLFYLRKGFEVCGILEDVYVAKRRNLQGKPYSFVKFSNVRDVLKLEKALNVVCFGHFRVKASVARFDRAARLRVSSGIGGDNKDTVNTVGTLPVGARPVGKLGEVIHATPATGVMEGVTVGNVMVPLGGRTKKVERATDSNQATAPVLNADAEIGLYRRMWNGQTRESWLRFQTGT